MLSHLPANKPRAVRNLRIFGHSFTIAYRNDTTPCIPLKALCEAMELDFDHTFEQFGYSAYLSIYWHNILLPDKAGEVVEMPCLELFAVPMLLIGINLNIRNSDPRNGILKAFCDDAICILAEAYHVGDAKKLHASRVFLRMDVADTLSMDTDFPDPFA